MPQDWREIILTMPEPYLFSRGNLHSYSSSLNRGGTRSVSLDRTSSRAVFPRSRNDSALIRSILSAPPSVEPNSNKERTFSRIHKFDIASSSQGSKKLSNSPKYDHVNGPVLLRYQQLNNIDSISAAECSMWSSDSSRASRLDNHNLTKSADRPLIPNTDRFTNKKTNEYSQKSSFLSVNGSNNLQVSQQKSKHFSSIRNGESAMSTSPFLSRDTWNQSETSSSSSDYSPSPVQSRRNSGSENESHTGSGKLWSMQESMKKTHAAGLQNLGNTCFMNAVLQCLAHTQPLMDYCLSDGFSSDINMVTSNMKGSLIRAFANLMQNMWKNGDNSPVNPRAFKNQIQRFSSRFTGYSQQDAQEFLHYLLQGLHSDVNRVTIKPFPFKSDIADNLSENEKAIQSWKRYLRFDNSRIVDIFVGQLKSTLTCTVCKHTSVTFDPFWDLSLPIPKSSGKVTLHQCLSLFTKDENLSGDENPICSKCNVKRNCIKSFKIHKFPKILILHLKRFSHTGRHHDRLNTMVQFPISGLDLTPYVSQTSRGHFANYNLYAVVHHSGSAWSGHYVASCYHPFNCKWYKFDDTCVSATSAAGVVNSGAYVLFYELASQSSRL